MFDSIQTILLNLKAKHSNEDPCHYFNTPFQGQDADSSYRNCDDPLSPPGHGGEVVADGQHHYWEE